MSDIIQDPNVTDTLRGVVVGGIIGVLGSIGGVLLAQVLKRSGKLILFQDKSNFQFQKNDGAGNFDISEKDEADLVELIINIDIYNQTEFPKPIGNLEVFMWEKNTNNFLGFIRSDKRVLLKSWLIPRQTMSILPRQPANIVETIKLTEDELKLFEISNTFSIHARTDDKKVIKFPLKLSQRE